MKFHAVDMRAKNELHGQTLQDIALGGVALALLDEGDVVPL